MSDYTELVKALRCCIDDNIACFDCPRFNKCMADRNMSSLFSDAADAIEELQEDNAALNGTVSNLIGQIEELSKPRWIPVTERLPEKHEWVLRYSVITEATWLAYINSAGVWMDEQGEAPYITHWMHLPDPPKEET